MEGDPIDSNQIEICQGEVEPSEVAEGEEVEGGDNDRVELERTVSRPYVKCNIMSGRRE